MWRDPINMLLSISQIVIFGSSIFFTIGVLDFESGLKSKVPSNLASGAKAEMALALDGDEVAILKDGKRYVVRLMGIKSFEGGLGKSKLSKIWDVKARSQLASLKSQSITLQFPEFKLDKSGRLLSYIEYAEKDIGLSLIESGLAFAYDKYPFSRLAEYMVAEHKARKEKLGYWQFPQVADKVDNIREVWEK